MHGSTSRETILSPPASLLSTKTLLRLQCQETVRNVRLFENWMVKNPWLNEATIDLALPWFAYVCFNPGNRRLVLLHFGELGWRVAASGEIRKEVDGVTIAITAG
jgi:hypothetical protein